MRLVLGFGVNAQCANPNNNSGPCGGGGPFGTIIVIAGIAAILILYVAFWLWLRLGGKQAPHTHIGRRIGQLVGAAVPIVGKPRHKNR